MPILSSVFIQAENNQLILQATDLDVGVIAICPAQVIEPGTFTVDAQKIQEMLNTLSGDQVSFSMSEGSMLGVVSPGSQFNIETMNVSDFPSIPDYDFSDALNLDTRLFQKCVNLVIFSISGDPHKYALNGCLLRIQDGVMEMVSTDGHRMSVLKSELSDNGSNLEILIPRKTMVELKKLLGNSDLDGELLLGFNEGRLFFKIEDRVLFSRYD